MAYSATKTSQTIKDGFLLKLTIQNSNQKSITFKHQMKFLKNIYKLYKKNRIFLRNLNIMRTLIVSIIRLNDKQRPSSFWWKKVILLTWSFLWFSREFLWFKFTPIISLLLCGEIHSKSCICSHFLFHTLWPWYINIQVL
jgi:hypothetical protein